MGVDELSSRHPEYRKAVKQLQGEATRQRQMPLPGKHVWRAKVLQRVHETREELAGVQQHITELEHETRTELAGVKQRITKLEHETS